MGYFKDRLDPDTIREEQPRRRAADRTVIGWLERNLSSGAKVATAIVTIVSCLIGGATAAYKVSTWYVTNEVFAGEISKVTERLDKSELRDLEGRLLSRRGQILDLERKVPLTQEERTYLNTLRGDVERLQQDIADIRAEMLKRKTTR